MVAIMRYVNIQIMDQYTLMTVYDLNKVRQMINKTI